MNLENIPNNQNGRQEDRDLERYWQEIESKQNTIKKYAFMYLQRYTQDPILRQSEDDVVNEVLMKIHRNLKKYNPQGGELMTWVNTIVKNHVIDYIRKNSKETSGKIGQTIHTEDLEGFNPKSDLLDPEKMLLNKEQSLELQKVIDKLSPSLKEIFTMSLYGIPYEEITQRTGLAMGTVKSKLFRAREQFLKHLSKNPKLKELRESLKEI